MSRESLCCLMSAGLKEIKMELHAFDHKASEIVCPRRLSIDLHKAVWMKPHAESVCLCNGKTDYKHL